MAVLGGIQAQDARHRVQYLVGRVLGPPLFEPRVPGDPDAGELRDLLAPQTGCTASAACGQAHLTGGDAGAAGAQEGTEGAAVGCRRGHHPIVMAGGRWIQVVLVPL